MRGDRPLPGQDLLTGYTATPHARGSTRFMTAQVFAVVGYPACAGIDPGPCICFIKFNGLPRMRGDRPSSGTRVSGKVVATPHARGSTG